MFRGCLNCGRETIDAIYCDLCRIEIKENLKKASVQMVAQTHPPSEFQKLLNQMNNLHVAKDKDYSGEVPYANIRVSEEMGIPAWKGAMVRLCDKVQRLKQFARCNSLEVKDESVEDTLLDLANYALITLILFKERTDHDLHKKMHIELANNLKASELEGSIRVSTSDPILNQVNIRTTQSLQEAVKLHQAVTKTNQGS